MAEGVIRIPISLRQFQLWCDAKELCNLIDEVVISIRRIGNGTLSRHLELKVRAERAVTSIHRIRTLANSNQENEGARRPKRALRETLRQVDVLERELLAMRMQMNALIRERDDTRQLYENLKRRFHEELAMALRNRGEFHDAKLSQISKPSGKS